MKTFVQHKNDLANAAMNHIDGGSVSLNESKNASVGNEDLNALVASVKRKSIEPKQRIGKRVKVST